MSSSGCSHVWGLGGAASAKSAVGWWFDDVIALLSEELTDLAKLVAKEQKRERDHAVR